MSTWLPLRIAESVLRRAARPVVAAAAAPSLVAAWLSTPGPVAAHGPVPDVPPTLANLLLDWTFEPLPTLGIVAAVAWWRWAVRTVDRRHPSNPVPRRRSVAFLLAMLALAVALVSGIDRYDTTLFSVHMVQHVLLALVAAPLLALSAPITLLLRVSAPETRRRVLLPVLHSRVVRVLSFPVVAWVLFAAVMWVSHFSPLFDAALEDPLIHDFEHLLFLGSAMLYWWPVVALDPAPWRMSHAARTLYTSLQMPQNTFLAVVILSASTALYPHYETLQRSWGPSALDDQRMAAGIMWLAGDTVFIVAMLAVVAGWMRRETRDTPRSDRRAAAELADIRVRADRLAERLARERDEAQSGSGASR